MIGLFSSKSLCDQIDSNQSNTRLGKYHSTSLLINSFDSDEFQAAKSSLASSETSSVLSLSQDSLFNMQSEPDTDDVLDKPELTLKSNNLGELISTKNKKFKKKFKQKSKILKNINETKQLAMFTVKRDYNELQDCIYYSLNESSSAVLDNDNNCFYETLAMLNNSYNLSNVNLYLNNLDSLDSTRLYTNSKQTSLGCLRRNKENKSIKFKTLLKYNDILAFIKPNSSSDTLGLKSYKIKFSKQSLNKSNSSVLYIKYNIYSKLTELTQSYVSRLDRSIHK